MNRRKLIAVAGILLILGIFIGFKFFKINKNSIESEVHYHAGFLVFKDGQKVDFSGAEFMHMKPCGVDEHKKPTPEEIQLDKAHLHGGVGDVVHVHTTGAKWGDLFENLNYPINYSTVTAYINGQKIEDVKSRDLTAYDSLVLFENNADENKLTEGVTRDRIIEVENTSVECGE